MSKIQAAISVAGYGPGNVSGSSSLDYVRKSSKEAVLRTAQAATVLASPEAVTLTKASAILDKPSHVRRMFFK